ncbi:HTTM domain-containing protein [Cellulophaga tyrosinoxydans]|uniref:Vitamin K-dependent gamma-carboxylase n=1 Tax=Cellulophaga tyrosinoxydans TaxID=504486 RepID=A0A1W2AKN9_9FLAO|nr:HTTM domain-containing protein [Cellulophaga tyrosinoxydans]SMC60818.1 Vitamin K-dependent gamma-carboxylase [Cellulophaga tyrosinoxydans]
MNFNAYLNKETKAANLAVFRVLFGLMMFFSTLRFLSYGWVDKLYIQPKLFFSYYGFEWIRPLGVYTYALFIICLISSFLIAIGYKYRYSIIIFFLCFTYIELMDKTTYLNHYYFVSCLSFLMIFLPANGRFSLDAYLDNSINQEYIPKWNVDGIKVMLFIVYFYAGLAKLNSDWLVDAMPLKIWLPSNYDLPILGNLLQKEWVHYAFSWGGALYDLMIPFLLLYKPTRWFGFFLVVVFHLLTSILFPIGVFPFVMIVSALIFFDSSFHEKLIAKTSKLLKLKPLDNITAKQKTTSKIPLFIIGLFLLIQLLLPWRYLLYKNELFWTEEGYRFSWRVMLMEKAGYAQFKVVDKTSGKSFLINNNDFLTSFQEKQMSTQPDFILQYAHYLADHFSKNGKKDIAVYVESYVALNGRLSQPYVDPNVDLAKEKDSFAPKKWILSFNDEIKGL